MPEPVAIDRLLRGGTGHAMTAPGLVYRSLGLRGAEIVATSPEPAGLDDLVSAGTLVVDAGDLTFLPAFADAHEHLLEASRNAMLVPVDRARSVGVVVSLPPTFAGKPFERQLVSQIVRDKLGLGDVSDNWVLRGKHAYLQLRPRQRPPERAPFADPANRALPWPANCARRRSRKHP